MNAVVEAVRPADGTQDAEASRTAIKDALSEVLTIFPDADLLNLTVRVREHAEHVLLLEISKKLRGSLSRRLRAH